MKRLVSISLVLLLGAALGFGQTAKNVRTDTVTVTYLIKIGSDTAATKAYARSLIGETSFLAVIDSLIRHSDTLAIHRADINTASSGASILYAANLLRISRLSDSADHAYDSLLAKSDSLYSHRAKLAEIEAAVLAYQAINNTRYARTSDSLLTAVMKGDTTTWLATWADILAKGYGTAVDSVSIRNYSNTLYGVYLTGAGPPDNADGKNGDIYWDSSNLYFYFKAAGVWRQER